MAEVNNQPDRTEEESSMDSYLDLLTLGTLKRSFSKGELQGGPKVIEDFLFFVTSLFLNNFQFLFFL